MVNCPHRLAVVCASRCAARFLLVASVGGPEQSFKNYTYIAPNGRKVSRPRATGTSVPRGILQRGGYVALWPDFYGSVAILPLTDDKYTFTIEGASIAIGHELAGQLGDTGILNSVRTASSG